MGKQGDGINDPQPFTFLDPNQVVAPPTHQAQAGLLIEQAEGEGGAHRLGTTGEITDQLQLAEAHRKGGHEAPQPGQAVDEVIRVRQLDQLQIGTKPLEAQLRHEVGPLDLRAVDAVLAGQPLPDHQIQARLLTGWRTAGKDHLIGLMQLHRLEDRLRTAANTDDQNAGHGLPLEAAEALIGTTVHHRDEGRGELLFRKQHKDFQKTLRAQSDRHLTPRGLGAAILCRPPVSHG